ncbi:fimbrillin family protein [Sphingobacterium kitahiroshimense]|uniref:fimbrillin family protein n=1 Tax=Sphingobacterium kitahiroshimense TaxID=470446 RepID=UPI00320926A9
MKKNIISSSMRALGKLGIFATVAILVVSCQKNDDKGGAGAQGPAKVTIKVGNTVFDNEVPIGHKSKSGSSNTQVDADGVQSNTVSYNDEFDVVSELKPVRKEPKEGSASASGSIGTTVALEEEMGDGFKYKVAIFDEAGRYIYHRNYERNYEGGVAPIILDGGKRYTFVAYSLNNKQTLPEITFSDPANKTLSTATVSVNGTADLMYFSKSMIVSGEEENGLDITFKHLFSQITTTIDASQTGYNITAVSSGISRHMPNASIALADGDISRSGAMNLSYETFSTLGTTIVQSDPTIINALAGNIAEYRLLSLTVGPVVQTNLTPFTGLNLTPGVKYNLKIKIVRKDKYLIHEEIPAVRINGEIWMRHNLGVNTTLDPDALPMTSNRHGNYYQWGHLNSSGDGTANTQNANFSPDIRSNSHWKLGEDDNPQKVTRFDPCPAGYRIPRVAEFNRLIRAVISTVSGDRTDRNNNFSGAAVLISKQDAAIKMTIPVQGGMNTNTNTPTGVYQRGNTLRLWTATVTGGAWYRTFMFFGSASGTLTHESSTETNPWYKLKSIPIRCIAE